MSISLDVTTGYITRKMTGTNDNDKFFIRALENYSKEEKYVRMSISVFKWGKFMTIPASYNHMLYRTRKLVVNK